MTDRLEATPLGERDDPLLPNARIVARREFRERVRSQPYFVSSVLLAGLAVVVAFLPMLIRVIDRGSVTTIAIQADDPALAQRTSDVMAGVLRATSGGAASTYSFRIVDPGVDLLAAVGAGNYDGAIL